MINLHERMLPTSAGVDPRPYLMSSLVLNNWALTINLAFHGADNSHEISSLIKLAHNKVIKYGNNRLNFAVVEQKCTTLAISMGQCSS